ncbi:MAG: type II toxin-antitoxin system HicA family toxin [Lachnospiraceae bacterium]|nr:type II toxin-antitoxin system HicA family toxin [Lachnospiraceae bacterium]
MRQTRCQRGSGAISAAELKSILERFGFTGTEIGSSHITYRRDGYPNVTIPRHGDIKRTYIKMVEM